MQSEYITLASNEPEFGEDMGDGMTVVNVSHEFPEDGFSYDDMRADKCRAYVRVTLESAE